MHTSLPSGTLDVKVFSVHEVSARMKLTFESVVSCSRGVHLATGGIFASTPAF